MKVSELIKELSKYDPNTFVVTENVGNLSRYYYAESPKEIYVVLNQNDDIICDHDPNEFLPFSFKVAKVITLG